MKEEIDPWRDQTVQWFTVSNTEIILTPMEICTNNWEWRFEKITVAPSLIQLHGNSLRKSFLLDKKIKQLLGHRFILVTKKTTEVRRYQ